MNTSEAHEDSTQRIGDFLVRIGAMTESQVTEVLDTQAQGPGRLFGEIAIEMGFINDAAVDTFLANRQAQ